MSARVSSVQVDVGEAFGYVFHSRNWVGKLLIGVLCLLFFWVFFLPLFLLLGYFIEAARTISRGAHELPPWTNLGTKFVEGFLLSVVLFVWNLPGAILTGDGFVNFRCVGSTCTPGVNAFAPLGWLYGLLLGLLTAAIWSQFIDGGFGAAFDFRAVFRRALQYPGLTVTVWLLNIVATIIAFLGLIVVLIGMLFTLPYAFAVTANLYGQFCQRTRSPALAL